VITKTTAPQDWETLGVSWQIIPENDADRELLRDTYGPGPYIFSVNDELPIRAYRHMLGFDEHMVKALIIVARDRPQYIQFDHYPSSGLLQVYSFTQFLDMDQPLCLGDHAKFDSLNHRPIARLTIPMEMAPYPELSAKEYDRKGQVINRAKSLGQELAAEIRTDKELFGANA
jgi:hypothetical protein